MREGKEAKQGQLRICILLQSHHSNPHPCFSIYLIIINSQNNIIFFPSLFKFLCPFFPFLLTLLLHIPVIHAFMLLQCTSTWTVFDMIQISEDFNCICTAGPHCTGIGRLKSNNYNIQLTNGVINYTRTFSGKITN